VNTLRDLVKRNREQYPDSTFLNFYDEVVTFKDVDERSSAFANYLLALGIKKGDVVSYMLGNSPYYFYVFLGITKIGAVAGPISCWWQAPEVEYLTGDSRPRVLIMDAEYVHIVSAIKDKMPSVEKIVVNAPANMELDYEHDSLPDIIEKGSGELKEEISIEGIDTALIIYTAGTTGKSKGVLITHRGLLLGAEIKTKNIPVDHGDVALCVLPLFHMGGLGDLSIPSMYRGVTIVLRRNFSASEFWDCVEKYKVNAFYIVPTMWNILLRVPESKTVDTTSLRFGISGAAPIPPEQLKECEERFHVPILEAYGATENSGGITANLMDKRKAGSIGLPFPGIEVKIFDDDDRELNTGEVGEIVVKGDTVMKGYYNMPEATEETLKNGWLHTGDIGYVDKDGFFFIVDRKKEMIIRGGVNIFPKELEAIIYTHPKVQEVAIIPESHDKYGQVAKACVVLKRGETATEEDIREFCRKNMAVYKVPEHIIFREGLPTSAVGKVLKRELVKQLEEEESAEPVPVSHFFEEMPGRFIPEKAEGIDATISYNVTGKGGGKWTIRIKDRKMTLEEGILVEPTVYLLARDKDYHDIVTGKLDGATAVVTGKLKIEGDVTFMAKLREMMKPLK